MASSSSQIDESIKTIPNTFSHLRTNRSNDTLKYPLAIQYIGIKSFLIRTRFIDSSDNDRDKERIIKPLHLMC